METNALGVEGGQNAPQGPLKNSRRIAAGRDHSHCYCPEGELGNVSFSSDQDQIPLMIHDGPPTLTASTPLRV